MLHVVMLPDFGRADAIGTFWGHLETRTFGELLIDLEEDKAARARQSSGHSRSGVELPRDDP
jgi:hypothetical protein